MPATVVPPSLPGVDALMARGDWLWAEVHLIVLLIPVAFLFTGLGARLRNLCSRISGDRWFLTVGLFAALYFSVNRLVIAPLDYYRDRIVFPASGAIAKWAAGEIVGSLEQILGAGLLAWIPYLLIRRSPRFWWLYAAGALVPVAFLVLTVLRVDPLTAAYRPLEDRGLRAELAQLAARCGLANVPILVGGGDNTVVGVGPTSRIVLSANLTADETPAQIRFTIGHELGHYVEGDNYKALAIIAGLLLVGFFFTDRLGRATIARYKQSFGFSRVDDPASLPLIVLIIALFWLVASPLVNLFERHIEREADRFGLELTHENRATADLFAAGITRDRQPAELDLFFLIFRATHPSNADRIRFADAYHPWDQGRPLVYGDACRPL